MAVEIMAVREPGAARVECVHCSQCCRYAAVGVDAPTTPAEASHLLWLIYHGITLGTDTKGEEWWALIETNCAQLDTGSNLCRCYTNRPEVCRDYDRKDCEVNAMGKPPLDLADPVDFLVFLARTRPKVWNKMAGQGRYISAELAAAVRERL